MKAKISSICLAILLLASSFVLFACGNKGNSTKAYNAYSTLITEIGEEESLFKNGSINELETDYYLNDFYYKDSLNNKIYGHNNYVNLIAVGLEFINEYHVQLDGLKKKTNYNEIIKDAEKTLKLLNMLKKEHSSMIDHAEELDYAIFNGYFARYKASALKFLDQVYDSALSLAEFLSKKGGLDKSVATSEMTVEALEFYCDYNILKVFDDFRYFFNKSCKGVVVDDQIYREVLSTLSTWTATISTKGHKALDEEKSQNLVNVFDIVNNERTMTRKALSKFSVYEYANTYAHSINAYTKANSNAWAYLNRIEEYFVVEYNTISNLFVYLLANVVA